MSQDIDKDMAEMAKAAVKEEIGCSILRQLDPSRAETPLAELPIEERLSEYLRRLSNRAASK